MDEEWYTLHRLSCLTLSGEAEAGATNKCASPFNFWAGPKIYKWIFFFFFWPESNFSKIPNNI